MTKKQETDQFNLYSTPIPIIERFDNFYSDYKKFYNRKATKSDVGARVLDVGLTLCEEELKTKKSEKK